MIERCCLQLGQQATQETNLLSISGQTEGEPRAERTVSAVEKPAL